MENKTLLSLASNFFKSRGYDIEYNIRYVGFSGILNTLDMLVRKGREEHAIFVMDWNKTVGINMIIKADKVAADVDLAHPIIIAKKFSDHAMSYSNKKRIILMTKRELLSKLGKSRLAS